MTDRYLSTSKGPAFCKYATSKGERLFDRGYWNSMPVNSYLSGDGLSPCYRGAGYYVPSERGWIDYKDHRSLPSITRRDAIHMDSEDKYREFTAKRDSGPNPSGKMALLSFITVTIVSGDLLLHYAVEKGCAPPEVHCQQGI